MVSRDLYRSLVLNVMILFLCILYCTVLKREFLSLSLSLSLLLLLFQLLAGDTFELTPVGVPGARRPLTLRMLNRGRAGRSCFGAFFLPPSSKAFMG